MLTNSVALRATSAAVIAIAASSAPNTEPRGRGENSACWAEVPSPGSIPATTDEYVSAAAITTPSQAASPARSSSDPKPGSEQ